MKFINNMILIKIDMKIIKDTIIISLMLIKIFINKKIDMIKNNKINHFKFKALNRIQINKNYKINTKK